jgi:ABC-type uncharacterized transport system substrate-binding protein
LWLRADDPRHHQVLILHSYHQSYAWTAGIHAAMMRTLLASDSGIDIRTEYLDWKHFPTQEMLTRQLGVLAAKYQNVRFDVVLTSDNAAMGFALQQRAKLFPGVPIVFCGVNGWRPDLFGTFDNVTGIAERVEAAGTLALALKVQPGAKRIVVICDQTETGKEIRGDLDQALAHLGKLPELVFMGSEDTPDLVRFLVREPSTTLVLIALFSNDAKGRFLDLWELAETLRKTQMQAPVWTLYEEALGHGVIGGHLQGGERQGSLAATQALRILNGEPAASIPIVQSPTVKWVFDDRELRRFGFDPSLLPANSEIRFTPPSFYHQYRAWVLGSLLLLLIGLAGTLAWSFALRRIVRQRTAKLQEELAGRQLAEQNLGHTVTELQHSLAMVKHLSGLIPICAHCKKIRSDQGYWQAVEHYLAEHTNAHFSHGICPQCADIHYPEWKRAR